MLTRAFIAKHKSLAWLPAAQAAQIKVSVQAQSSRPFSVLSSEDEGVWPDDRQPKKEENPNFAIEEMKKVMTTLLSGREFNKKEFEGALDKVNRGLRAAPDKALQESVVLAALDEMVSERLADGNYTMDTLPYIADIITTHDRVTNN